MLFVPLWRSGPGPGAGRVTQLGLTALETAPLTVLTELGVTGLETTDATVLSQFSATGLLARRRTRVTQIAAMLIWQPAEPPAPPDLDEPCLTAPPVLEGLLCALPNASAIANEAPVVAGLVCAQPSAAPIACPTPVEASSWQDVAGENVVPTVGLNESDVQP